MKSKITELILIAAVVGSVYTDDCVFSPWKRGVCNCKARTIPVTRTLLSGEDKCKNTKKVPYKTQLYEPCNCGKYIFTNNEQLRIPLVYFN